MKVYEKYKDVLAKHGYTVDVDGCVWDERGNQAAIEDRFGNAFCNDPNVTEICRAAEVAKPKAKKKPKAPEGKKRARTAKGHYVKDDPNTPENEAWVDE